MPSTTKTTYYFPIEIWELISSYAFCFLRKFNKTELINALQESIGNEANPPININEYKKVRKEQLYQAIFKLHHSSSIYLTQALNAIEARRNTSRRKASEDKKEVNRIKDNLSKSINKQVLSKLYQVGDVIVYYKRFQHYLNMFKVNQLYDSRLVQGELEFKLKDSEDSDWIKANKLKLTRFQLEKLDKGIRDSNSPKLPYMDYRKSFTIFYRVTKVLSDGYLITPIQMAYAPTISNERYQYYRLMPSADSSQSIKLKYLEIAQDKERAKLWKSYLPCIEKYNPANTYQSYTLGHINDSIYQNYLDLLYPRFS